MTDPAAPSPPLADRAGHLAEAVVRFVAGGLETTTAEERVRRATLCRDCPEFAPPGLCRRCGCRLGLKIRMATEHCPLDRW